MRKQHNLKKWILHGVSMAAVAVMISACSPASPLYNGETTARGIDAALSEGVQRDRVVDGSAAPVPTNIHAALLPTLSSHVTKHKKQAIRQFDVSVKGVDAQAFFMGLVRDTNMNMLVHPNVTGTITLELKHVTIEQVLDAVHSAYGYEYTRTSYGYEIFPPGLETRVFKIDYLDLKRTTTSSVTISSDNALGTSSGGSGSSSITTTGASDFWTNLKKNLDDIIKLGKGGKVIVDPASGVIMVKAYPKEMRIIAKYLDLVEHSISREVLITAKVLEIELSKAYDAGVNWSKLGLTQDTTQSYGNNLDDFGAMFTVKSYSPSFTHMLKLLSTQGNLQTLSSPRVSTLNNQKAIIKVGTEQYYATNAGSTSSVVGESTTTSSNVSFSPYFSGIALGVTPQIGANGEITLHIHPIVSDVTPDSKTYTVDGKANEVKMALSKVRETDSIVRVHNGQVIAVGGLMESDTDEDLANTPFMSKMPMLGAAFKRTHQVNHKKELIILLKAVVLNNHKWSEELSENAERFKAMNRGFHFGGYPETFGVRGEYTTDAAKQYG